MAVRIAIASGNWSNTATWSGGIVPAAGDNVYSNNNIITIDVNATVKSINNNSYSTPDAIPLMTSLTTPSGIASNLAAFDRNFNTDWISGNVSPGVFVSYEFPTEKIIDVYYFGGYSTQNNWAFEAWDGTDWVTLHTVTGASVASYTSPSIGNTTAYIKYRFILNDTGYRRIHSVGMYEAGTVGSASSGGRFIINDGLTVTAETFRYDNANNVYTALFVHTGTGGTTTLIGNALVAVAQRRFLSIEGTGTFNFVGTLYGNSVNQVNLVDSSHTGTINFTGDIYWVGGGSNAQICRFNGGTVTITGNLYDQGTATSGSFTHNVVFSSASATLTIIGNVYNQTTMNDFVYPPETVLAGAVTIIGSLINSSRSGRCLGSTSSLVFLTGPFESSSFGFLPYMVSRLFIIPTNNTYFEFRNNSTGGIIPPFATPGAVRLLSPDAAADAPIPSNVRKGIIYLEGNLTGTMAVPGPSSVTAGIEVDNTVGTAVLDPTAIWAVPLTSTNTLNSIGRRVRNAATVETTGAQIQQTLNNNE